MEYTHHYDSPLQAITPASNVEPLIGLEFDDQKYFANTLTKEHEQNKLPIFKLTEQWLDIYFSRQEPSKFNPFAT